MITKEQAENLPKYTPSPMFKDLPDFVKDPKNFYTIENKLLKAIRSTCNHEEVVEWHKCKKCQKKVANRQQKMKEYGFTSPQQYFAWKQVMDIIVNKKKVPVKENENIVKGI